MLISEKIQLAPQYLSDYLQIIHNAPTNLWIDYYINFLILLDKKKIHISSNIFFLSVQWIHMPYLGLLYAH